MAVVNTVGEPVFSVSHQITAKRTNALPTSENACPTQIVKKRGFQFSMGKSTSLPSQSYKHATIVLQISEWANGRIMNHDS